jgi:tetratricopeptide (TPR) repeat protein
MRFDLRFAAALALGLAVAAPALAAGDNSGNQKTCPPGEAYDARQTRCVKQGAGILPDKDLAEYAYSLAKAERYAEAIQVLDLMKNPDTAEGLNYRGYASRHLGRLDEGIGYYERSVALNPRYAQVREYLGEAYVLKGDMARAKAQLKVIKTLCGTECEEYVDLAKAIVDGAKT